MFVILAYTVSLPFQNECSVDIFHHTVLNVRTNITDRVVVSGLILKMCKEKLKKANK